METLNICGAILCDDGGDATTGETPHFPYFELLTLGGSCACHDYCCQLPISHRGGPSSVVVQSISAFRWTQWHYYQVLLRTSVYPSV